MTSVQYPGSGPTWLPVTGPNLGWAFDNMGRLNTMTDLAASSTIISGATYGPSNELLTMSGLLNESRSYNSMLQLTGLTSGSTVSMSYSYSSTQNNGKITSQTDAISGETVVYTYDALNRLASATATNSSWGQSYQYDGFGNLTNQTVTAGSAPAYTAGYDANNHMGCEDANGNNTCQVDGAGHGFVYDVENRPITLGNGITNPPFRYSYAPGNKRVWRGLFTSGTLTTDEVTFWGVNGQKLAVYQLTYTNQAQQGQQANWVWYASQTGTNYYFGGKLIKNAGGFIGADRLGSIGHFYPYGQEKPSATTNGTEKFTGYLRDAETGMDYADQRFHSPGTGRFLTPDPYMAAANGANDPTNPGSWNRYAYVEGDPVNFIDRAGLFQEAPQPVLGGYPSANNPGGGEPCTGPTFDASSGCVYDPGSTGPPVQPFGASSGDLSVTGYSRTGAKETTIANDLDDILTEVLTGGCAKWLTGANFSAADFINAIMGSGSNDYTFGYGAVSDNSIAAFVGHHNADGTVVAGLPGNATITVNSNGAFFNSAYSVGSGRTQYTGGSLQAQIFILVHELAHEVGAAGFGPDLNNQGAEDTNNALVQKNCGKQIAGVH